MPLAEVCDRYTISKLKHERIKDEDPERLGAMVQYFAVGIDWNNEELTALVGELEEANKAVWDAEAAIRAGQDEDLGLEEIGRRALHIRDVNRVRVGIKNRISDLAGDGMQDVKVNHASG